tara:strand:+ start:23 stop:235 length:213 start_codon:yes stop_codon:yes gene_type:complete
MAQTFLTALFFPDYGPNGAPWDLYLLHFFFFTIFVPFLVILFAARSHDKQNPNAIKNDGDTPYPNDFPTA